MRHAVLSPPVAMRFVLAGIALVVLLVASGTLKVEFWAGSSAAPAAPPTRVDMRSATVRDVVAVTDAARVRADDLDEAQINGLLTRYESDRRAAALASIDRAMPGFSRRVDLGIRRLSRQVESTRVTTKVGDRCRRATLTFLRRQRLVFARFARDVKRDGATSAEVDRFMRTLRSLNASYPSALHRCTAQASREDREALAPLLDG
jgi:hypothetical protein